MDSIAYVEPQELADILTHKDNAEEIVVIDVRSVDEYDEGHIKGAVNLPSDMWSNPAFVDDAIKRFVSSSTVVFHCAQSRIRGPTCAKIFRDGIQNAVGESKGGDNTVDQPSV